MLSWWTGVVLVLIAAWPVLGLVEALASAGLHLRGSSVRFIIEYKKLEVGVHTPKSSVDPHPVSCFLLWAVGTAGWVGCLLAILN